MNLIAIIILITLITDFTINLISDLLNLKNIREELPDEFQGYYDSETYKKSQEYLRANTRFGFITSTFSLLLILVFWFGKGFPMLDQWVRTFSVGTIYSGLIYTGTLILGKSILSLPFSIYSTFVIEERFGFNKTTWKTYIIDTIKSLILSAIIGTILLSGIIAFFEYTGNNAWLYCWIAATLFMLMIQYIVPTWIMPLFNKFTPLEDGDLRKSITSYAESINFSLENIFVMDGSKRSSKSNAFFTGFGKHKRIVLFDTLIEKHTVDELVSVLAHEMGHYKKKHILQMMIIGIVQMGIMFFLLSFFLSYKGLFEAFYIEQISIYAGLIFFGMLYSPIDFFTSIAMNFMSRKNEFEADRFAVETAPEAHALAEALKKLSVNNLSNLMPHPVYVIMNYSHPPVLERLKAIYGNKKTVK